MSRVTCALKVRDTIDNAYIHDNEAVRFPTKGSIHMLYTPNQNSFRNVPGTVACGILTIKLQWKLYVATWLSFEILWTKNYLMACNAIQNRAGYGM